MPIRDAGRNTRKHLHTVAVTAIAGLPLLPGAAWAQNAVVLDPIEVTATEVAPGGVQIGAEDIEDANPASIKDVFDGVSSVNVGGGSDVSRKSYVNGIEDTNLNVKIDGARQINSAFHHLGTVIIDPGLLKSVTIETGVGPADVGPGALGGSIAYETKDARDIVAADETIGGFFRPGYETNSDTIRSALTLAARHDELEALVYGSYEDGTSYENGDGVENPGTAPKLNNALGKFAWSGIDGDRIELSGSYLNDSGIRPNRANFGALLNGAPPTLQAYKRQSVSISYRDEAPTDMVNPELVLSANRSSLSIDELAFGPNQFHLASTTTSYSGKLANTFATDLGFAGSGSVTAGADFYRDVGEGDISGGFAGAGVPLQNEETSLDGGVFVQARLNFTQDLRVSAGGRYDQQWFEGIDGTDIDEGGLSGNVNVEYDLQPGITGYTGAANNFGPIPLGESAIYNFGAQWTYDGLKNSRSRNYKVGLKGERGAFSGDAHLYLNEILNSHDRGNTTRNTTRNIDSRGFNLSGRYNYDNGYVRAGFSHNKLRSDGQPLASGSASFHGLQLGDIVTIGAVHEFAGTGIRVGAAGELAFSDDDVDSAVRDGYFVADIFGAWTPPDYQNVQVRLDVRNLLDRTYVSRATSADADNAQATAFTEPGRTFMLTTRIDF